MDRRRALQLGGAIALAGAGAWTWTRPARDAPSAARRVPDRSAIVDRLRTTPTRDMLSLSAELFARGVTPEALLGALFVAPVLTGSDNGDVHSVLTIEPVARCIAAPGIGPLERRLAVAWAVSNTADWLRDDRPPEPADGPRAGSAETACAAIVEHIAHRDAAAADRAVVDSLALAGPGPTARALALAGLDSPTDPHRLIYLEQALRGVRRFEAAPAPMLRSVARYMARTALPPDARIEPRPPPLGATGRAPGGASDAATTRWLLDGLVADPDLVGGSDPPPGPAWHALTVWAMRALRANPSVSGPAVHGISLLHAARGAWQRARGDAERRFILGRAARWLVTLAPSGADAPGAGAPGVGLAPSPAGLLATVARAGSDAHDFKSIVAALELRAALPEIWRGEADAAVASARVVRAPAPWPQRPRMQALLASSG